jgi:hypothetical protein
LGIIAKTCGCKEKEKKVTYSFVDNFYDLCIDKKDIILSQLEACELLLKYATGKPDEQTIKKEIDELRAAVVLMH